MQLKPFGKSIKTQLVGPLFALTALAIIVVGFLGIRAMLDSGGKAENITSTAMQRRAEQLLVQAASATASENSLVFKNIQTELQTQGAFVTALLDKPANFANTWKFDGNVSRLAAGQYTNNRTDPANILIGNYYPLTPEIKREIERLRNWDHLGPQALASEPNAVALWWLGPHGESYYYPNNDLASFVPPDFDPSTADFFTIVTPEKNPTKAIKWTDVYDDPAGHGLTITASYPNYSAAGKFISVTGMDITLNAIAKNIEGYSPIESSYSFLIDNKGRAVALPADGYKDILSRDAKKDEFGPDLSKVKGDFGAVLGQMRNAKTGFATVNGHDGKLYVAYAPLAGTSFSVGIVANKADLLKAVSDVRAQVQDSTNRALFSQMLPTVILVLVLVWLLGFFYIRLITGPIIALTEKTQHIGKGSFSGQEIEVPYSNNEVGKLALAFNKMINELSASYAALQNKVVELKNANAKDEAILNSIGDGMIVVDSEGKILLINSIAVDLLGVDKKVVGRNSTTAYKLADQAGREIPPQQRPMALAMDTRQKIDSEVTANKNTLSLTATPVMQNGQVIGAIQIIRDVTKQKEVDRMKTEFISIASHQLRTPLSGIKWFSGMLLKGDAGKLNDEQADFVKNITGSTDRMIELVNSLLNISKLEAGHILSEVEPTDLKKLVTDVTGELKGMVDKHKQTLEVKVEDGLPKLKLDPRMIGQVYSNLLTNAIKYTKAEGKVAVEVVRKGNEIVSQISDNGYGIPKAEQAKMFNKFFRGTNVVKVEPDGNGLGMYLVKSIVEASGGKIWFESTEGKGSTFWFTLPATGVTDEKAKVKIAVQDEKPKA